MAPDPPTDFAEFNRLTADLDREEAELYRLLEEATKAGFSIARSLFHTTSTSIRAQKKRVRDAQYRLDKFMDLKRQRTENLPDPPPGSE